MKALTSYRYLAGMVLTFAAFLCLFMPSVFREAPSQAAFADVAAATTKDLDMSDYPLADQSVVRAKLGLEPTEYQGLAYYRSGNAMNPGELLIIQYAPDQAPQVLEKVEDRIESQKQIYQGYAPEQLDVMNKAVISQHANYLLFATGPIAQQARDQFEAAL